LEYAAVGKTNPGKQESCCASNFDYENGLEQQESISINGLKSTTTGASIMKKMVRMATPATGQLKQKCHYCRFHLPLREWGKGSNQKPHHCQLNLIRFAMYLQGSRRIQVDCGERLLQDQKRNQKFSKGCKPYADSCRIATSSSMFFH
jgi:hypothetical protein